MSTTYNAVPASEIAVGDRLRPLLGGAGSAPRPGQDDAPWTVSRIQPLTPSGRFRIWAHPFGSRRSVTSAANYGSFSATDLVERAVSD